MKKYSSDDIYIRPIKEEDTEIVLKWRNSKSVVENFIYREPISREEHLNWLHEKVEKGLVYQFVVCLKADDTPVGSVYLQHLEEDKSAESGLFFDNGFTGCGIATISYGKLLDFAFDELGLERVYGRILAYNKASEAVHLKCGFTLKSYLEKEECIQGNYYDVMFYEISKEDWLKRMEGNN